MVIVYSQATLIFWVIELILSFLLKFPHRKGQTIFNVLMSIELWVVLLDFFTI